MTNSRVRNRGFTLAEMLVAIIIGAFIAMVSVGALRAITASSAAIDSNITRAAEVRYATDVLRRDLSNLFQYGEPNDQRFIGTMAEMGETPMSYLIFYTLCRTKARAEFPESELYEVSYYLQQGEESSMLMRQQWPNPDEELEAGGILSVIAEGIQFFSVRYFDGEEWGEEWPEDMEALPDLVEVTIVGETPEKGQPIMESFTVNLVRAIGSGEEETSATGSIIAGGG